MTTPEQKTPDIIVWMSVAIVALISACCVTGYYVVASGWLAWLGL